MLKVDIRKRDNITNRRDAAVGLRLCVDVGVGVSAHVAPMPCFLTCTLEVPLSRAKARKSSPIPFTPTRSAKSQAVFNLGPIEAFCVSSAHGPRPLIGLVNRINVMIQIELTLINQQTVTFMFVPMNPGCLFIKVPIPPQDLAMFEACLSGHAAAS